MSKIYYVKIHNKELQCYFCQGKKFYHRMIFLDVENPGIDVKHIRNYFGCIHCGEGRIFSDIGYYDPQLEDYFESVNIIPIEED